MHAQVLFIGAKGRGAGGMIRDGAGNVQLRWGGILGVGRIIKKIPILPK